ncbi:MAG: translation initiation factor IF-2 [Planctomycetes bacterium]|nr:translation initiation factor IF-2 [Planctomycetota bacterium]
MLRVSELAKDLGYKAAELIELARDKGIKIENVRAMIDARSAMQIKAHVPPRSKLAGALLDLYHKVQADLAAQEAVKAAEPKPERKKREPRPEGAETKTRRTVKKDPEAGVEPAAMPEGGAPKPALPPPSKKPKVVEEFRPGEVASAKTEKPKVVAPPKPHIEPVPIPEEAKKPLIDVDKVIGEAKEVHAVRPQEVDRFQSDRPVQEVKEQRHAKPAPKPPPRPTGVTGHTAMYRRPKPAQPPVRPTVAPPKPRPVVPPASERKIEVTVPISIKDFSQETGVKVNLILKKMIEMGVMATINHAMDQTMVEMMAIEFKRDITVVQKQKVEETVVMRAEQKDDPKDLLPRPPVVTFLGHVDHGKTSLLDRLRHTNVAAREHGGITQHIGASKVTRNGRSVVFLDTPGHEAFTAMRARGAQVTDVAVLVVAADDGVMPQTEEAINHAKAAGVKIVVALNKCDKPGANPNRVKGQLAALGLNSEDWGGNTVCVEVSALTGLNVDQLFEMLALEADLLELRANPKRAARGTILEARKTEDRGVVATVLVQNGTLRRGDAILAGRAYGRVRAMSDHTGGVMGEAGPATPVELLGFMDVPDAGDKFMAVADLLQAKEIAEERRKKEREDQLLERQHLTLENLFSRIEKDKLKEVRVIVKVDVKGSLEVLKEALAGLSTDEVKLRVLHASVGAVNESDVVLADASDAIIIGFHVDVEDRARDLAKARGVETRIYTVIYQAVEEMKAALEGLLEPEEVEARQGTATVKEVFRISRVGAVAGCIVSSGKIERSNSVRLVRDGKVVHTGRLESLKRFKDDVREVQEGFECGIKLAGHDDVRPGDIIEAFAIQKIARKLERK